MTPIEEKLRQFDALEAKLAKVIAKSSRRKTALKQLNKALLINSQALEIQTRRLHEAEIHIEALSLALDDLKRDRNPQVVRSAAG